MDMKQPCSDYTLERWLAIFLGLLFLLPWVARGEEPCGAAIQFPLQTIDDFDRDPVLVEQPVGDPFTDALSERIALRAEEHDARLRRGRWGVRERRPPATPASSPSIRSSRVPATPGARPNCKPSTCPKATQRARRGRFREDGAPKSLCGVAGLFVVLGITLVAISPRVG